MDAGCSDSHRLKAASARRRSSNRDFRSFPDILLQCSSNQWLLGPGNRNIPTPHAAVHSSVKQGPTMRASERAALRIEELWKRVMRRMGYTVLHTGSFGMTLFFGSLHFSRTHISTLASVAIVALTHGATHA